MALELEREGGRERLREERGGKEGQQVVNSVQCNGRRFAFNASLLEPSSSHRGGDTETPSWNPVR